MSQAPSMPVFTDALLGDTLHLSVDEFGAYCLLLFATWRNNGRALPDSDTKLARICRVSVRRWTARLRPVLVEFFDVSDGSWHQKRLEKEWQFCARRAAISRSNGSKGGRAKRQKNNGTENPAGQPQPSTHTHTQFEEPKGSSHRAHAGAREKNPISPIAGIFQGFADALAASELSSPDRAALGALLDDERTAGSTARYRRGLA